MLKRERQEGKVSLPTQNSGSNVVQCPEPGGGIAAAPPGAMILRPPDEGGFWYAILGP